MRRSIELRQKADVEKKTGDADRAFRNLHQRGISVEDVVEHMTFVNEYTHQIMNSNYGRSCMPAKVQRLRLLHRVNMN